MTVHDISGIRLMSQQIATTKFKTAKQIVGWMGAMQAQDYGMARWAIGIRMPKTTDQMILEAIDEGEIFRTHVLRPTWHFVSADDIKWMLKLSAPRLKSAQKSREKQLELSEKIFSKCNAIFEKALQGGNSLTRAELIKELLKSKIKTTDNRSSHILFNAEIEGILCSGVSKNKQPTYALLEERVPQKINFNKDEALYNLARKYFESHCPATLQDFTWWSGLTASEAKLALQMIKVDFFSEEIDSKKYWFHNSFTMPKVVGDSAYLLPAFDEFLISYKDRSAAIDVEHQKKAFSNNGIFWPTIVIDGRARGIWKKKLQKDQLIIETRFFDDPWEKVLSLIESSAKKMATFLQQETFEVNHSFY